MYSLVIPVYKNEGSIPELLLVLNDLNDKLDHRLEVVFVVDGSPDRCAELLNEYLPGSGFQPSSSSSHGISAPFRLYARASQRQTVTTLP